MHYIVDSKSLMFVWDPHWVSIIQLSGKSKFPLRRLGDIAGSVDEGYLSAVKETRYFKTCEKVAGKESKDIMIPVPPMDTQLRLAEDFRSYLSKVRSLEERVEKLLNGFEDMIFTRIEDGTLGGEHLKNHIVSNLDLYLISWDAESICRNHPRRARDDAFALKDLAMVASVRKEKCLSSTKVLVSVSHAKALYEDIANLGNHDKMQKFCKGDVILSRLITDDKVPIWLADCDGIATNSLIVLECDGTSPEYMMICLKSKFVQSEIFEIMIGRSVRRLRYNDLKSIKIPMPPRNEELKIFNQAARVISKANVIKEKAANFLEEGANSLENAIQRKETT